MKWKWSNVPVPEAHVVGLVVGIMLQLLLPQAIFSDRRIGFVLGGLFVLVGAAPVVWAVLEVSDMAIESSDRLLVTGPYALSRNPMCVSWALMTLGAALLLNTIWLLALIPPILLYVHFVDIDRAAECRQRSQG